MNDLKEWIESLENLIGDTDAFIKQDENGYYCKQCNARFDEGGTHELTCLVSRIIELVPLVKTLEVLSKAEKKPEALSFDQWWKNYRGSIYGVTSSDLDWDFVEDIAKEAWIASTKII